MRATAGTPGTTLTDEAIADRAAGNDLGAFARLMRRHGRALFRTARGLLGDDAEARRLDGDVDPGARTRDTVPDAHLADDDDGAVARARGDRIVAGGPTGPGEWSRWRCLVSRDDPPEDE
ncbi:hypothetical protein BURK1_02565 [Burkholderiales bacterium]|nr:hypothetical protein BURK1_02565 [Burkholderiales bacterium]